MKAYYSGLYESHSILGEIGKQITVNLSFVMVDYSTELPPTPEISIPLDDVFY